MLSRYIASIVLCLMPMKQGLSPCIHCCSAWQGQGNPSSLTKRWQQISRQYLQGYFPEWEHLNPGKGSGDGCFAYFRTRANLIHYVSDPVNSESSFKDTGPLFSKRTDILLLSWSFEATRLGVKLLQLLWKLTGTSAALLPRCLSNFSDIVTNASNLTASRLHEI